MATQNFSVSSAHSNNTDFRTWGKALGDALKACSNLTQTADTGQIDWAAATRPTANLYGGYEIYRFNDALQSTTPVFIKIEYGTGSNASYPAIRVTIGTGSDGSGNLTGNSRMFTGVILTTVTSSTSTWNCYVSHDAGRLDVAMFVGSGTNMAFCFSLCRTRDDTGAMTDEGVDFVAAGNGTKFHQFVPREGTGGVYPEPASTNYQCAAPNTGTGTFGLDVGVYPVFPYRGYAGNPTGVAVFFQSDFTSNTIVSFSMYGAPWTYVAVGNINISGVNGNANAIGLMIRNE